MILAGDAQMENWAAFDQEGLLEDPCAVLKSAHHGSSNGTQWERLRRLEPSGWLSRQIHLVAINCQISSAPQCLPSTILSLTAMETMRTLSR